MAKPLENLKKIKHEAIQDLIENGLLSSTRIYVGMSTCEIAAGSKEVWNTFENEIKEKCYYAKEEKIIQFYDENNKYFCF